MAEQEATTPDLTDTANEMFPSSQTATPDPVKTPEQPPEAQKDAPPAEPVKAPEASREIPPKEPEPAKKDEKPEATADIKLVPPKDSRIDQAHADQVAAFAKANGLTQAQAEKLLERDAAGYSASLKAQEEFLASRKEQWYRSSFEDKELGGGDQSRFSEVAEYAKRAINRFGSQALRDELDSTGYGNHPELIRLMSKVGRAMSDGRFVKAGARDGGQEEDDRRELLYPDMKKKN